MDKHREIVDILENNFGVSSEDIGVEAKIDGSDSEHTVTVNLASMNQSQAEYVITRISAYDKDAITFNWKAINTLSSQEVADAIVGYMKENDIENYNIKITIISSYGYIGTILPYFNYEMDYIPEYENIYKISEINYNFFGFALCFIERYDEWSDDLKLIDFKEFLLYGNYVEDFKDIESPEDLFNMFDNNNVYYNEKDKDLISKCFEEGLHLMIDGFTLPNGERISIDEYDLNPIILNSKRGQVNVIYWDDEFNNEYYPVFGSFVYNDFS